MIAKTKIGAFRATWVLRHRWEKGAKDGYAGDNYEASEIRRTIQLGIWARRYQIVGRVKNNPTKGQTIKHTFSKNNLVNSYMVGLDLIVCKVWVEFSFRPTFGQ